MKVSSPPSISCEICRVRISSFRLSAHLIKKVPIRLRRRPSLGRGRNTRGREAENAPLSHLPCLPERKRGGREWKRPLCLRHFRRSRPQRPSVRLAFDFVYEKVKRWRISLQVMEKEEVSRDFFFSFCLRGSVKKAAREGGGRLILSSSPLRKTVFANAARPLLLCQALPRGWKTCPSPFFAPSLFLSPKYVSTAGTAGAVTNQSRFFAGLRRPKRHCVHNLFYQLFCPSA